MIPLKNTWKKIALKILHMFWTCKDLWKIIIFPPFSNISIWDKRWSLFKCKNVLMEKLEQVQCFTAVISPYFLVPFVKSMNNWYIFDIFSCPSRLLNTIQEEQDRATVGCYLPCVPNGVHRSHLYNNPNWTMSNFCVFGFFCQNNKKERCHILLCVRPKDLVCANCQSTR